MLDFIAVLVLLCSRLEQHLGYLYHVQRLQLRLRVALTSTNRTQLDSVLHSNGDFKKYSNISRSDHTSDKMGWANQWNSAGVSAIIKSLTGWLIPNNQAEMWGVCLSISIFQTSSMGVTCPPSTNTTIALKIYNSSKEPLQWRYETSVCLFFRWTLYGKRISITTIPQIQ